MAALIKPTLICTFIFLAWPCPCTPAHLAALIRLHASTWRLCHTATLPALHRQHWPALSCHPPAAPRCLPASLGCGSWSRCAPTTCIYDRLGCRLPSWRQAVLPLEKLRQLELQGSHWALSSQALPARTPALARQPAEPAAGCGCPCRHLHMPPPTTTSSVHDATN